MPQVACHISFCGSLDYHLKQVMQSQLSYINGFEDVKMKKTEPRLYLKMSF